MLLQPGADFGPFATTDRFPSRFTFACCLLHGLIKQTAFTILDEVIKATNRRVNAIEHVVMPRLENTINYINSELDEMDR